MTRWTAQVLNPVEVADELLGLIDEQTIELPAAVLTLGIRGDGSPIAIMQTSETSIAATLGTLEG